MAAALRSFSTYVAHRHTSRSVTAATYLPTHPLRAASGRPTYLPTSTYRPAANGPSTYLPTDLTDIKFVTDKYERKYPEIGTG